MSYVFAGSAGESSPTVPPTPRGQGTLVLGRYFPDETTTGVPAGTVLTPSGSITADTPGAVYEDLELNLGFFSIEAANITIRRCLIRSSLYPIRNWSYNGLLVEDCEIDGGVNGVASASVLGFGATTLRRCHVLGGEDCTKFGGNCLIEDCYIHDPTTVTGGHHDAMQMRFGSNTTFKNCNIRAAYKDHTSAMLIQTGDGTISNVRVENCLLHGGGYTLQVNDKGAGYGPVDNAVLIDNIIVKDAWIFGSHTMDEGTGWLQGNNKLDDGTPLSFPGAPYY